ncbi:Uncharacterised protein [Mycobacterium tuberculosis]|nr:Uncharacterised protein [Mycobacterium tuberculosis]CNF51783.1 Uncharacterised protein [Mycobacterium tuberculosis]CNJ04999.1 Uncharacterised protein [Mycobacterium tuberculosis]
MGNRSGSSDPKPREGTETLAEKGIDHESCVDVVRPKTPRGDGNNAGDDFRCCGSHCRQTQNPERGRKRTPAPPLTIRQIRRRQTQNPERGRKLAGSGLRVLTSPVVVRPKTPRGDGNPTTSSGIQSHGYARSSDPKPREGTETCIHSSPTRRTSASRQTQNPERGRKLVIASRRAWRADCRQTQNPERGRKHHPTQAPKSMTSRRQTQNPERGRKPDGTELSGFYQVVVRPKTPRGDGNPHGGTWTSATIGVVRPKTPRGDGNWTQNRTGCGRCSSRQTQNPERGRKRISPATPQPRYCSMSSDPKPREGTETHRR